MGGTSKEGTGGNTLDGRAVQGGVKRDTSKDNVACDPCNMLHAGSCLMLGAGGTDSTTGVNKATSTLNYMPQFHEPQLHAAS